MAGKRRLVNPVVQHLIFMEDFDLTTIVIKREPGTPHRTHDPGLEIQPPVAQCVRVPFQLSVDQSEFPGWRKFLGQAKSKRGHAALVKRKRIGGKILRAQRKLGVR